MGQKHTRPAVPPPIYEAYSADDPTPLRVDFALYGAIGGANVTAEALAAHSLGAPYASPTADLYVWRVATHAGAVAVEGPLRLLPQPALLDPLLPILLVLRGVQPERLADATPAVRQAVLRGEATLHVSNAALGGDPHVGTAKQLLLCATRRGTHQTVVLGPVPEGQRLPLAPLRTLGLLGSAGRRAQTPPCASTCACSGALAPWRPLQRPQQRPQRRRSAARRQGRRLARQRPQPPAGQRARCPARPGCRRCRQRRCCWRRLRQRRLSSHQLPPPAPAPAPARARS